MSLTERIVTALVPFAGAHVVYTSPSVAKRLSSEVLLLYPPSATDIGSCELFGRNNLGVREWRIDHSLSDDQLRVHVVHAVTIPVEEQP